MGGCRCSYRNCSVRSDGKTHMFHYPVFDKVRCHQWLTNAGKLGFLQLKLSQLKNRVVCQHHFKDEYFMNFKKDKLKHDAVPTENGPYCSKEEMILDDEPPKQYAISLEDIENEYLTITDKKANFCVKYGDFLTNSDGTDLPYLDTKPDVTHSVIKISNPRTELPTTNSRKKYVTGNKNAINENKHRENARNVHKILNSACNNNGTNLIEVEIINPPYASYNNTILNHTVLNDNINKADPINFPNDNVTVELPNLEAQQSNQEIDNIFTPYNKDNINITIDNTVPIESNQFLMVEKSPNTTKTTQLAEQNDSNMRQRKKIQIISEKKIVDPVPLVGKLEPVSFSDPLLLPKRKGLNKSTIKVTMPVKKKVISPERVAAIEKKRKFNMKLRDIIETCLQKLDAQDTNLDSCKAKLNEMNENNCTSNSKEHDLSNIQECTMAYLDSRMKKMENNLISKIDFNSQRILELKQTIIATPSKKNAHTQTIIGEEARKKQLYQEISQYLSPDANSLVFEELFINRFKQHFPKKPISPKRRKVK